jgi:hypothetical protein
VMALGTFERQQLIAGTLRLDAEQAQPRSAFEAGRPYNRIGVRCGRLISGHASTMRLIHRSFLAGVKPGRIIHSAGIERIHKEVLDFERIEAISKQDQIEQIGEHHRHQQIGHHRLDSLGHLRSMRPNP